MRFEGSRFILGCVVAFLFVSFVGIFLYELSPVSANAASAVFEVKQGQGFRTIIGNLKNNGLIRSTGIAEAFSVFDGAAFQMQPGLYKVSAGMSTPDILELLSSRGGQEVTVTIPEGDDIYQIDTILTSALVIHQGDLINFKDDGNLEGKLFPDTYNFFTNSNIKDVVKKFLDDWNAKAAPLLAGDAKNADKNVIVASLLEKEVPDPNDQKIVAGIIWKRVNAGMPLDIDATICYIKFQKSPTSTAGCYPLSQIDYRANSPYNTYLNKGLPPAPIGNPGITALTAAINPKSSAYWFYLSDPKTGKTIFAETLDEQDANRVKYLKAD